MILPYSRGISLYIHDSQNEYVLFVNTRCGALYKGSSNMHVNSDYQSHKKIMQSSRISETLYISIENK